LNMSRTDSDSLSMGVYLAGVVTQSTRIVIKTLFGSST
jgi:hypothetical protein